MMAPGLVNTSGTPTQLPHNMLFSLSCIVDVSGLQKPTERVPTRLAQFFLHMMIGERAVTLINSPEHEVFTTQFNNFGVWTVFWKFRTIRCCDQLGMAAARRTAVRRMTPSDSSTSVADVGAGKSTRNTVAFRCEDKIIFLKVSKE